MSILKFQPHTKKILTKKLYVKRSPSIGWQTYYMLKKRIAINYNRANCGLPKNRFWKLQNSFKKKAPFFDQRRLKITRLGELRKLMGYKADRLRKQLPLRGQRTHTNARTRKKRNIV